MKKMILMVAVFSIMSTGFAGCGNADDNAVDPGNDTTDFTGMNEEEPQRMGHDEGEFTVDDRVERGERHGSRNMRDGRGSFYLNNPMDVVDKDTYTEEERQANAERAHRYETYHGSPDIEQKVNAMDNVVDSNVLVAGDFVIIGIQTSEDDAEQTLANIEQQLQAGVDEKKLLLTDDVENYENLGELMERQEGTGNAVNETSETLQGIIEEIGNGSQ